MKTKIIRRSISAVIALILISISPELVAQSEVVIKKNASDEPQISIQNNWRNIFLGNMAGDANDPLGPLGQDNVFIGETAGKSNTLGNANTFLGSAAGNTMTTGSQNTFIGGFSGQYNTGSTNTFLGNQSGLFNTIGAGNIFLGFKAGQNETGSNRLYIENSNANSTGALIYGEFDNNYLRLNANVNINGAYTMPSISGTANQVLTLNGSNQAQWSSFSGLADNDNDTRIEVELFPDDDMISMLIGGDSEMNLSNNSNGRLLMDLPNISLGTEAGQKANAEDDIFVGNGAGKNIEDGSDNTFLGSNTGSAFTNASMNTIVGSDAGSMMTIGEGNTFLGFVSGMSSSGNSNTFLGIEAGNSISGNSNVALGASAGINSTGNNNVFLGASAGTGSIGGNKLYIENSNANSSGALIYGEFDNDFLRLNAEVNINGHYTLPNYGGLESQVLSINGSNEAQWSSLAILSDNDGDTRIELEESDDDDIVRFHIANEESLVLKKNASGKLMIEPENISIGIEAGMNSSSNDNVFIGHSTGINQTGFDNTFVGNGAGQNGNSGNENTFLGSDSGKAITGENNTFIGASSGEEATGDFNTFLGHSSGKSMNGLHNAVFGDEAGAEASGEFNIFMGSQAGKLTDGNANIFVGNLAGNNFDGSNNIALGVSAGENASGNYNVFLGQSAGTGSAGGEKLFIENTNADSTGALIYGEFNNDILRINGKLGIGATPTSTTDIYVKQSPVIGNGGIRLEYQTDTDYWDTYIDSADDYNFGYNGNLKSYIKDSDGMYTVASDRRLKEDITTIASSLSKIKQLRATQYRFKNDKSHSLSTGFIAQEVQAIFPEFVSEKDGMLRISYDYFIPVAIAGIQELSEENKMLKDELENLKEEIQAIKELLKK